MPVYSDIDIELSRATDGDITRDTEFDAVENSLKNIITTMQGSRRMLPEFAVNIYQTLFEPMDENTAYTIGTKILEAIEQWDDRIIISNVNINANYDSNQYEVKIDYGIKDFPLSETRTVDYILRQD